MAVSIIMHKMSFDFSQLNKKEHVYTSVCKLMVLG